MFKVSFGDRENQHFGRFLIQVRLATAKAGTTISQDLFKVKPHNNPSLTWHGERVQLSQKPKYQETSAAKISAFIELSNDVVMSFWVRLLVAKVQI